MDDLTRQVLSYVNDMRQANQCAPLNDLEKGYKRASGNCPLANSIPKCLSVSPMGMSLGEDFNNYVRIPFRGKNDILLQWIAKFDDGFYPQYEAEVALV